MNIKEVLLSRLEEETTYEDAYGLKSVKQVIEEVFKEAENVAIDYAHSSLQLKEKCKMSFGSWKQSVGLRYGYGKYIDKDGDRYTIDMVDKLYEDYYNNL